MSRFKTDAAYFSINSPDRWLSFCGCFIICSSVVLVWFYLPNPLTVIALCIAPLAMLSVIRLTFWLVILFVIFSFFRIHEVVPTLYPFKLPLLLSAGALASLSWHFAVSKRLSPSWHPSLSWLIMFWILIVVGVIFASNRAIALEQFKGIYWKIIVMTLAIIWVVENEKQLSIISCLLVFSGLLVGCTAIYNSFNHIGLVEGSRVTIGRDIGSMLGDPNDLALVLMFPLAFSISTILTRIQSMWLRVFALITSIVLSVAIIETQSRGGLLGALTVCSIFALRHIRSKLLIVSMGIIAAGVLYIVAGISERASGGAAEIGVDASAMGRLYAWQAAFRMAVENPFTGVGLNNFYYNYYYYSSHWDGLNHAVHSTWFGVLAETGFLGFSVFVALIISLIRTARRTIRTIDKNPNRFSHHTSTLANAVYAGLVGTVVSGTFLTQGFNWPIYILAALTIAVAQIACQNENRRQTMQ